VCVCILHSHVFFTHTHYFVIDQGKGGASEAHQALAAALGQALGGEEEEEGGASSLAKGRKTKKKTREAEVDDEEESLVDV